MKYLLIKLNKNTAKLFIVKLFDFYCHGVMRDSHGLLAVSLCKSNPVVSASEGSDTAN